MGYYSDHSDMGLGGALLCILLAIVLFMISSCNNDAHVSSEREDANMVYIKEGYCYDADTKIIYRETITGRSKYSYDTPIYTPYINENGNYCKYEYGKWVEFVKTP